MSEKPTDAKQPEQGRTGPTVLTDTELDQVSGGQCINIQHGRGTEIVQCDED